MAQCKIHNVRFYNPEPQAIRCMSIDKINKKLALSRSDASLEIWNLQNTWYLERSIASTTENISIESLAWCDDRLLSVGLHGLLVEYNLNKLCIENRWALTGEAAFCLDINNNNTNIAIGTEQGYLNLFTIEKDGIYFNKFFDKQEGRILTLKFDKTGEFIVSGSTDVIRIWNVKSGHAIHKMTTGREEANKPTIVWTLDVTNDFTIISGDSRGKLTFWDGKVGAQIESYQSHKADILSICLSDDQNSLFCAGVDPIIIKYERITVKDGMQKWVRSIQRRIHEHDVNSMILVGNKLYSGGADSYLACSFYPPKTLLKVPPLLQSPCVHLASKARYILLRYPKHVELWSLGKSQPSDDNLIGMLAIKDQPKKILELQRISKNFDGDEEREGIICTSISNNGKWIFYSTIQGVNLFQFIYDDTNPSLVKVDDLENRNIPCLKAIFTPDNQQLITYSNSGYLYIYKLVENRVSINQTLDMTDGLSCVTFLLVSGCGKYLIVGDVSSNIIVFTWNSKKNEWVDHCKLPRYKNPPVSMNIHPETTNLIVIYSDSRMIEYDVPKKHFTQFSREWEKSNWKSKHYPIRNITFDPRSTNIIILQDDSNITIINKEKSIIKKKAKLIKKEDNLENGLEKKKIEFGSNVIKKYKHLVHLEWLEEDEMVAVEVNPLSIIEQLPPAFQQSTFGKK